MGYEDIRQQAGVGDGGIKDPLEGSAWNPFSDHMGNLKSIIEATKPEPVDKAGNAFSSCASNMERTAELLYEAAKRLSDNWQGDASDAALKKLKEMYTACQEIHEAAQPSGVALEAQAGVLRKYKQIVGAAGGANAAGITTALVTLPTGGIVTAAAANQIFNNRHAKQLMQDLNEDTKASNDHFPMHMRTDLPARTDVRDVIPGTGQPPGGTGGGGAGGGAGAFPKSNFPGGSGGAGFPKGSGPDGQPTIGGFPGGSIGSGAFPSSPSSGGLPDSAFPGSGGAGTDLAGFNPGAGGTGGGAGGIGNPDPFGAGASGSLSTGSGGAGTGGGLAGGFGASGGKGATGRGMMPMAPHAGGQGDEKERERSTWLTEDEDVWSAGDDAAPPVIG